MIGLGYKDLPRQTSADYLTGCTDENERQFAEGKDFASVPSTPEAMEAAYRASDIYKRMEVERQEYQERMKADQAVQNDFRQAVVDQKHKGVSKKSPYTVSFFTQVVALAKRQLLLKSQDRFGIYTSFATSIIIGKFLGSLVPLG
jgi:ATP-binding cassette subfamily G (WHITE) protein 2 (SNQ2)